MKMFQNSHNVKESEEKFPDLPPDLDRHQKLMGSSNELGSFCLILL